MKAIQINKKSGKRWFQCIVIVVFSSMILACSVHEDESRANTIAELVSQWTPEQGEMLTPQYDGKKLIATGKIASIVIPETASEKIVLTRGEFTGCGVTGCGVIRNKLVVEDHQSSNVTVSLGFPHEAQVGDAEIAENGSVVYQTTIEDGFDVVVQAFKEGSVRIETIIPSIYSTHEFTYSLGLPEDATVRLSDNGAIDIVDASGHFLAGLRKPWAKDVHGNAVPTSYRVEGHTVIQVVERMQTEAYPIVADPWLGIKLIKSVSREYYNNHNAYRYYVTPTSWGRGGAGLAARWAAWEEALSYYSALNSANLRDQFLCHYDMRPVTTFKGSWNLEAWRPDVGYLKTVAKKCNP